jgi:hypothetical protein
MVYHVLLILDVHIPIAYAIAVTKSISCDVALAWEFISLGVASELIFQVSHHALVFGFGVLIVVRHKKPLILVEVCGIGYVVWKFARCV